MAQPLVITVGPLASADDDNVSLSQTAAASQYLVINGAGASGTFSATSICASQTPSGSGALTIDGTLATTNPIAGSGGTSAAVAATVRFPTPSRVYITCAGNNSGRTFTIVGTVQSVNSMGTGAVIAETVTGANANVVASANLYSSIISISISGSSTGAVTVGHSGVSTLDVQRRIIVTSGGDDSSITFTIVGTDGQGATIGETLTGANGIAQSLLSYKTVTSIKTSAAAASTVKVGTNTVADSPLLRFDDFAANSQVAIQCSVSGTANGTVSQTLEDPNRITNQLPTPTYQWTPATVNWLNHPDTALVGFSTTVQGNYGYAPLFARVTLNSGSGSITSTFRQAYMQ